ncbi:glycogen debranching protein GlgX [Aliiglaciecola sp. LCG003]|uniref:glycogen debranching protein GlgX n=1 Tax=Aliiglaciecola sp. LCG003 TaxID=3053655 RepID=UPI002573C47E|nr:glycogen debranching protein GlgX [Aliiglaciecola sp. LCG003]WJG07851.1 glycogen debranching protein GlgX [Aliiglaciecola sp. LCG003]
MTDFKIQISEGKAHPLGANLTDSGCNFAVHCPDAQKVMLCFFKADTEEPLVCVEMMAKTGRVWHCHLAGVQEGQLYGYRTFGGHQSQTGVSFDPEKLLIDPYAKRINRPIVWNEKQYQGDSHFMMPKCVVVKSEPVQNLPTSTRPYIPLSQTIVYEAHVKGLTQLHTDVPLAHQGKYLGACHPVIINHLQELGVTTVQLLPVMAFMPEPFISQKGLTNYWGYNPVNFFSPEPRYAVNDPIAEFKTMINTFHQAGLEVILDVVYNHTAEGSADGPILSFKGFDNASFYLFERNEYGVVDYQKYVNNSGCGNSVNTAYPYVLKMVMDSLRYWVSEMGVDGFRFDLAASLGRDPYEFSSFAGFFRTLRQDPILAEVKLIAEPWDIGHGGYRLGQFPSNWHETNDKYRDTVRGFWRGDKALTADFATRLLGSRDIFPKGKRSIHSSVNNVTYHDGFTLHDMVTYAKRHNEANLENNRDGHGHNLSENYGVEGPTLNPDIMALREKQKRNLFTTLMLSQGIPHILGGDELSKTQLGNNNAYCQDNELNWLNWQLNERQQDFLDFCKYIISLRKNSMILSELSLLDDNYNLHHNVDEVNWYRPDGATKVAQDWHDPNNKAFAVELKGCVQHTDEHWLLIFNAFDNDVRFHLPELETGIWQLKLDTRYKKLSDLSKIKIRDVFLQAYRSVSIFQRT